MLRGVPTRCCLCLAFKPCFYERSRCPNGSALKIVYTASATVKLSISFVTASLPIDIATGIIHLIQEKPN